MSSLVRQLIAFDMLKQELEDISVLFHQKDTLDLSHLRLLRQCAQANQSIVNNIQNLSEYDFGKNIVNVELEYKITSKQLLIIHNKLLAWCIDFFVAKSKANKITSADFSEQAEVRLDLLLTKAAKAKNHIKTLAQALGNEEYSDFISQYRLAHTELKWPLGK